MALTLQDVFQEGGAKLSGFKGASESRGQLQGSQGFSTSGHGRGKGGPRKEMRDDYGWKMTDDQYEHMQSQTGDFNKQVGDYKASSTKEINTARRTYEDQRGAFESSIKSGQAELDRAKSQLGKAPSIDDAFNKWYSSDNAEISIINGNQVVGTWRAPKSIVQGYSKEMKGSYSNWISDNHFVIEQNQPKGYGGHQYAWDAVKGMTDRQKTYETFVSSPDVQGKYAQGVGEWTKAQKAVSSAQNAFNESVAKNQTALGQMNSQINTAKHTRDTQIAKANANRKGQLDALRQEYLESLAVTKRAYGNLSKIERVK